jgi:hypothetical protein
MLERGKIELPSDSYSGVPRYIADRADSLRHSSGTETTGPITSRFGPTAYVAALCTDARHVGVVK